MIALILLLLAAAAAGGPLGAVAGRLATKPNSFGRPRGFNPILNPLFTTGPIGLSQVATATKPTLSGGGGLIPLLDGVAMTKNTALTAGFVARLAEAK